MPYVCLMSFVVDEVVTEQMFSPVYPVSPANHISHNYSTPINSSVVVLTRQYIFIVGNCIIYRCLVGLSTEFKSQCVYLTLISCGFKTP
jgi:hypothetical protein